MNKFLEKTVTGDDLEAADISDHIAEAYFGAMGESMRENSMKRIDWICDQVKGPRALDIGCSQGITEILLGRRQIHVLGVDIAADAIAYAERMLADEPAEVQQYIRFLHSDFLKADLPDTDFDTLILSEILEHLYDPEEMLKKAIAHVRNGGCVVITVPFGINDFPDHKQTFYVLGILEILEKYAKVEHIEFMGSWIGFVAYKQETEDGENVQEISYSLLRREEEAFFLIERALRDDGKSLRGKLDITTDKFKRAAENYETAKQWLADEKKKSAAALKRAAADYDALEMCYNTEKEERASAEMKFMQLEFYLQQREEESLGLQRSLTQRIVKTEKDLQMSAKRVQDAEEKLKEKTLPPIWYTMAGSRVGRMLCKLFGWYHNSKRIFRRQKRQSNSK